MSADASLCAWAMRLDAWQAFSKDVFSLYAGLVIVPMARCVPNPPNKALLE